MSEPDDDSTRTPMEPAMSRRHSVNSPGFAALVEDHVLRLDRLRHEAARIKAREGRALAATLRSWATSAPTDEERRRTIQAVVDFNREALDLLAGSR